MKNEERNTYKEQMILWWKQEKNYCFLELKTDKKKKKLFKYIGYKLFKTEILTGLQDRFSLLSKISLDIQIPK